MKPNISSIKNPMPSQEPLVRANNFSEVSLGYDEATAVNEALRCLGCKNMPCVSGCPVNIHIPAFIEKIKEYDFEGAYEIISRSLPCLPFAAEFVLRKNNVRQNVSEELRETALE